MACCVGSKFFLAFSGMMTLAIGALGVANILFLSVAERTQEFGVRLAMGATPQHLKYQVLFEGFGLVSCGGGLGLLISELLVYGLAQLQLPDWLGQPSLSIWSLLISLVIMAMCALCAAYFPAKNASQLNPVNALNARSS